MTKANIPQYSATAASNTDVQDIDIAENCAPSGINNAIREIMADLKDQDTGAVAMTSPVLTTADINGGTVDNVTITGGTADNITIGGSTPAAGTFSSLTATTADINAGTADNVVIGGSVAVAGTFTTVTATTGVYLGGTDAANLLDDYEEGTYTVQLFDASSGGNASSSSVTGSYTKVGNQVTVRFDSLNNIDTTGMTGANDLYFSLPFSSSSTGRSAGSVVFDTLTFASGTTMVTPQVLDSASRGQFRTTGTAVTDKITAVQDINSNTTDIHTLTLTYFTA